MATTNEVPLTQPPDTYLPSAESVLEDCGLQMDATYVTVVFPAGYQEALDTVGRWLLRGAADFERQTAYELRIDDIDWMLETYTTRQLLNFKEAIESWARGKLYEKWGNRLYDGTEKEEKREFRRSAFNIYKSLVMQLINPDYDSRSGTVSETPPDRVRAIRPAMKPYEAF